jgi:hypothetical protein
MKPFEVVSISDSALVGVPVAIMRMYEFKRDLSILPDDIWTKSDPPTVFKIKPLSVDWESVALAGDAASVRAIVREHVTDVMRGKSAKHHDFQWDRGKMNEETIGKIPISVCAELAKIIFEAQNRVPGGEIPFSPMERPTYLTDRDNSKTMTRLARVVTALTEETAEKKTD